MLRVYMRLSLLKLLETVNACVVSAACEGRLDDVRCSYAGVTNTPVTLLRYHIYQQFALNYPESTEIMVSDFRDVFFQSNPFKYKVLVFNFLLIFNKLLLYLSWQNGAL